jgi:CBS-domain-containing membrane protein
MIAVTKPLLSLTASDVMTLAPIVIPQEMSLQCAAHLLTQAHVSGAPVVNSQGRCVGVLSSTDFVHWVQHEGTCDRLGRASRPAVFGSWQIVDPATLPHDAVHNYMTPDPVTAPPGTKVGELAEMMIDAHIHRVIVTDSCGKPMGLVSSTDLLAALARAHRAQAAPPEGGSAAERRQREPQPC